MRLTNEQLYPLQEIVERGDQFIRAPVVVVGDMINGRMVNVTEVTPLTLGKAELHAPLDDDPGNSVPVYYFLAEWVTLYAERGYIQLRSPLPWTVDQSIASPTMADYEVTDAWHQVYPYGEA